MAGHEHLVDAGIPLAGSYRGLELSERLRDIGPHLQVFLDGQPIGGAIWAYDVAAGTLSRYVENENGQLFVEDGAEAPKSETLTGRVEVRWKPL